ncbi:class I SAM-dependent methyltransferase [Sphingomonas jaspsi]|uniref:class I SAM-dependent methyltransferase n=1 Tax=Sphingomonas jaspsi TaxID=392409 RepID=UPI0004BC82A9|nr:class I SAM-dependent methyltransferase [Sphingomonas jaspsi]
MRAWNFVALAALIVAPLPATASPADVATTVAAVADRSEANVKLDASRKPVEVLTFLGLEKGMRVADLFGSNLYWAEITAPAVGPDGTIVIWNPTQFTNDKRKAAVADFTAKHPNVVFTYSPFESPVLSAGAYDFLLMNLDYHDTYWSSEKNKIPVMDPQRWVAAIYNSMKPGGIVGIIDHAANPGGDTRKVVDDLHRIDPAVVRADFERAGFVLEAESDLLRNPADDHSKNVFDESIRGKTDRFIFKFRKPR